MTSDATPEPDPLPDDVRALLRERIGSYEQLEALLVLQEQSGGRTAEELSASLHAAFPLVATALAELQQRGLVQPATGDTPEPQFAYAPASAALAMAVSRLASAYAADPIPIIKTMSSNAIQRLRTGAVRAFADAFVLRKDRDE